MSVFKKDSLLKEALMENPSLIPVINRFEIYLGVGDKTIAEMCEEKNLNVDFFLSIINTFIDNEYFPIDPHHSFSLEKTVSYLLKTGEFYVNIQLPNIERHFHGLIQRSGKENNLKHLMVFFNEMKCQLEEAVVFEREQLFPAILAGSSEKPFSDECTRSYEELEEKLQDLLTFFIVHLQGDYDHNLCVGVVNAIFSLKKDLHQNNRIRTRILNPLLNGEN